MVNVMGKGDPNVSARFIPTRCTFVQMSRILSEPVSTPSAEALSRTRPISKGRADRSTGAAIISPWYGTEIAPLAFNDNCVLVSVKPGNERRRFRRHLPLRPTSVTYK